ncbi:MAG: HlyD family efflux transporter periplasmic adaptor subunit [Clostridia bacterium]|nr:HlyD family efflux transporter periplasmic adaptor subunit [Clostridia bacterium]
MKKIEKIIAIIVIAVGIVSISTFLLFKSAKIEVKAISVYPKSVERTVVTTGTVTAKKSESVTYDSTVYPKEIKVRVGDKINEGDIVMTALNSRLREIKIYSDYSGVVTALPVSVGKEARSGVSLAVVAKPGELQIKAQISERDAAFVSVDQVVEIKTNGANEKTYSGRISRVSNIAEQSSNGTIISILVDVDSAETELLIGMSTKLYIKTDTATEVIAVPYSSIEYNGSKSFVYVVLGDEIKKTEVEIGIEGSDFAEIVSGIDSNSLVIENKSQLDENKNARIVTDG